MAPSYYHLPQHWQAPDDPAGSYPAYQGDGYAPPAYGQRPVYAPRAAWPEAAPEPVYPPAYRIIEDHGQPWQRNPALRGDARPPRLNLLQTMGVTVFLIGMMAGTLVCAYYILSCFGFY